MASQFDPVHGLHVLDRSGLRLFSTIAPERWWMLALRDSLPRKELPPVPFAYDGFQRSAAVTGMRQVGKEGDVVER
jgi:hypothetical protein